MNRFAQMPPAADNQERSFELLPDGTYTALLEVATLEDAAVWVDGVKTETTVPAIKLTFSVTEQEWMNRKLWKTLRFDADGFDKAAQQLVALGVWEKAAKGKSEDESLQIAAHELHKLTHNAYAKLYVGTFNERNWCKVISIEEAQTSVASEKKELVNHAPQFDTKEELPF